MTMECSGSKSTFREQHPLAVSQGLECGDTRYDFRDVIVPAAPAHASAVSHVYRNVPAQLSHYRPL